MKKFFWMIFALVGLVAIPSSCNRAEDLNSYQNSDLTPTEHQNRINQMGVDFVGEVNSKDQETMVATIQVFGNDYVEDPSFTQTFVNPLLFDNAFDVDFVQDFYKSLAATFISSADITKSNKEELASLAEASVKIAIYDYLRKLDGKYTYSNTDGWKKTGELTDEIEMTFPVNNYSCVLSLKCTGNSIFSFGNLELNIPSEVEVKYSVDGVQQCSVLFNNTISSDKKNIDVSIAVSMIGNINLSTSVSLKDASANANFSLKIGKNEIVSTKIGLTGKGLSTVTTYANLNDNFNLDFITTASLSLQFMALRFEAEGGVANLMKEIQALTTSNVTPEQLTEIYAKNTSFKFYYTDTKEYIGQVKIKAYYDSSETIKIEPVIVFANNEEMTFSQFFTEKAFSSFIQSVQQLLAAYGINNETPA